MQSNSIMSPAPSFNTYSSSKMAEVAARVVEEFREESEFEVDDFFGVKIDGASDKPRARAEAEPQPELEGVSNKEGQDDEEDDDEFEFVVCGGNNSSPISADEIFDNGRIRPFFPLFNRDLVFGDPPSDASVSPKPPAPSSRRLSLKKLFIEERDAASCSSSEADELDGIASGTYCVWTPKAAAQSPARCKKSNSTGSSKRWKFRDLLYRSNSDGKDTFVFLTTPKKKVAEKGKAKGVADGEAVPPSEAHRAHYGSNRAMKEGGDRRRSYLPYRQDLVGLFSNGSGLSRNIQPF